MGPQCYIVPNCQCTATLVNTDLVQQILTPNASNSQCSHTQIWICCGVKSLHLTICFTCSFNKRINNPQWGFFIEDPPSFESSCPASRSNSPVTVHWWSNEARQSIQVMVDTSEEISCAGGKSFLLISSCNDFSILWFTNRIRNKSQRVWTFSQPLYM